MAAGVDREAPDRPLHEANPDCGRCVSRALALKVEDLASRQPRFAADQYNKELLDSELVNRPLLPADEWFPADTRQTFHQRIDLD
jgi:hypothetical protein